MCISYGPYVDFFIESQLIVVQPSYAATACLVRASKSAAGTASSPAMPSFFLKAKTTYTCHKNGTSRGATDCR
jgi:hypothetical protein